MKNQLMQTIAALGAIVIAGSASGVTVLVPGGDIRLAAGWDNGLPTTSNPGTIAVDGILGDSDTFGFGAGTVIGQTAGTIDAVASTNGRTGFNMLSGTWNLSGGKIYGRYVLSNGGNTIFNFSGGTVELADVDGTQHMGVANGGTMNVSGTVVLDGTQATTVVQTDGTLDIASDWTGYWTWGTYSGSDWEDLFTAGEITLDGATLDKTGFDTHFTVTDGGKTLSMVPEPSSLALLGLGGLAFLRRRRNK